MKVTSATVRLVLKKNKVNKNGEHPIHVVVCFSGRHEKSTGVSCQEKHWDSRRECIKASAPNAPVLNKMILDVKQRILDRKNEYEYAGKRYTPQMLLENSVVDLRAKDNDFWNICQRLINERRLKNGTISGYTFTHKKLKEYLGRDFVLDELRMGVVKDFGVWLEKEGIKINTIKRVMGCIAAAWNFAINRKLVKEDDYPFREFSYSGVYHEVFRDYFLEKSHIVRLRDYWLDLVIERNGKMWHYKEGAEEKLHQRWSKEWGILWFLLCYLFNGSSPIDVVLLRPEQCKRISIDGEDYWSINTKRRKTSRDVHIRLKRDLLTIIGLEHFLGLAGHFLYPVLYYDPARDDQYYIEQSHKASLKAIKWVREAFSAINSDIARDNATEHKNEPLVDVQRVIMYTARHSLANHLLNSPGVSVRELASILSRSPNTISTYIHELSKDKEIAEVTSNMAI